MIKVISQDRGGKEGAQHWEDHGRPGEEVFTTNPSSEVIELKDGRNHDSHWLSGHQDPQVP